MKKLLISVLAVALSWSAMAAPIAVAKITLTGATGGYGELTLYEDDNRTSAYESGYDAPLIGTMENSKSVQLYGFIGSQKYDKIYSNDLYGTEIGFITNQDDANYTLTFNHIYGSDIVLYDRVKNKAVTITSGTPAYTFEAAAGRVEVNNRFVIGVPTPATGYTVTPNAAGYATFSAAEATVIPTGATAYTGTISGEELVLNQITGDYVPANTGVIVAGVAGTPYNFAIYNGSVAAIADNDLKATSTYNTSMQNVYVLKGGAFLEYVGTNALAANKAFIQLSANNAPSRIRMVINGTTAVENVEAEAVKAEKFIENGQVFIRRGNEVYNLQGQIVK